MRVLKKRVLKKTFEHKRDEVTAVCKRLYSEELHNLFPSLDIIQVIQSLSMRKAEHMARMGGGENAYRV
jgi:hypothetical protein